MRILSWVPVSSCFKRKGNSMLLLLLLSTSVVSDSVRPHRRQPTRLPHPWDSPGRTLECVAISFSNARKWKVRVKSLSHVRLFATPWTADYQAFPHPWDSPGKNTGVGCHFLLQCMKVESESEVAQSCPTLRNPMDCSPPGPSVHGIFQARVLEWGAIAFSIHSY